MGIEGTKRKGWEGGDYHHGQLILGEPASLYKKLGASPLNSLNLTMTRIIKQPRNIGKFYFCTRKHIEVGLNNLSLAAGPKMLCLCFYVFFNCPGDSKHLGSAGWQADEYIAPRGKFFMFFMYLILHMRQFIQAKLEHTLRYKKHTFKMYSCVCRCQCMKKDF